MFDQFLLIPPFLKWEFGRTLENSSRISLCLEYLQFLPSGLNGSQDFLFSHCENENLWYRLLPCYEELMTIYLF